MAKTFFAPLVVGVKLHAPPPLLPFCSPHPLRVISDQSLGSAFRLSGTACLLGWGLGGWGWGGGGWGVGVGGGGGGSPLRLGKNNELGRYLSPPSPPVALSHHTSTGSLDLFLPITSCSKLQSLAPIMN